MSKSKLICNKLFSNPFFIALLLTVLVIIIIVAIFKVQKSGGNSIVACFIYTYICFSIILYVHNIFIKKTVNTSNVKKEVKDVFNGIDMSKEVSHDVIQIQPNLYDDEEDIPYIKKRNIEAPLNIEAPKLNIEAPKLNIEAPKLNIEEPKLNIEEPALNNNILNSVVLI
jgi:hypothetical protein